jgi:predicted nucleotidyltransferase
VDVLKALFTSEARARVLASLFSERGRRFYQTELVRATQLPLIAVQRELKRLVAAGLVKREVTTTRPVYSADTSSAVYDELASMIRKLRGPATVIRDALAVRSSVDAAFVFGSFAAGEATANSDVDLMVLTHDSARAIRTALGRAERDLGRTINEHVLTTGEWGRRLRRKDPFITNVRGGPRTWVVGDDDALGRFDARKRR